MENKLRKELKNMVKKIIPKDQINTLLLHLSEKYTVYVPMKDKNELKFQTFDPNSETPHHLDNFQNTRTPPKEILFPQKEVLFSYKTEGQDVKIVEPSMEEPKKIIFGVRSCDARSFQILDTFFASGKYSDPYYFKHRNATLVVGLACNYPYSTCFCTSVGGGPFSTDGLDAFLVDLGDSYLIESISLKGDFLIPYLQEFKDPHADVDKEVAKLKEKAEASMKSALDLSKIEKDLDLKFDDAIWQDYSKKCLNCSVCTFFCPTCHCFDVQEISKKNGGERVRIWDSCQSSLFTQEASGYNPRSVGEKRVRQRIYHKFNFYPKNYQILGCVGCGRCSRNCPEHEDIRDILGNVISG